MAKKFTPLPNGTKIYASRFSARRPGSNIGKSYIIEDEIYRYERGWYYIGEGRIRPEDIGVLWHLERPGDE